MFDFDLQSLIITIPAVVFALSFHEFAHARAAYALGDPTAKIMGRMTVNPLKHLDVVGTLMLIFFSFGWAKPVPFNPYNLRTENKYTGALLVSLAGPMMNLLQMLIASVCIFLLYWIMDTVLLTEFWMEFVFAGVSFFVTYAQLNLVLAIFNLIPIPPLDGSKILAGLIPQRWANKIYRYEQYGFIIMVVLLATGWLGKLITPFIIGYYDVMDMLLYKLLG